MSSTTLEINFIDYKPHEIFHFSMYQIENEPKQPILSKIVNLDLKSIDSDTINNRTIYQISFKGN